MKLIYEYMHPFSPPIPMLNRTVSSDNFIGLFHQKAKPNDFIEQFHLTVGRSKC